MPIYVVKCSTQDSAILEEDQDFPSFSFVFGQMGETELARCKSSLEDFIEEKVDWSGVKWTINPPPMMSFFMLEGVSEDFGTLSIIGYETELD